MAAKDQISLLEFRAENFDAVSLHELLISTGDVLAAKYEIAILIGRTGPYIAQSDKQLKIKAGDTVYWTCARPFRLKFTDMSPEGPDGPKTYHGVLQPGYSANYLRSIPFQDPRTAAVRNPNTNFLEIELLYDIEVEVQPNRWELVDPSIIIDVTKTRSFVLVLKPDAPFPSSPAQDAKRALSSVRGARKGQGPKGSGLRKK